MKKFSQNDDKVKKYAGNQVLKNKIDEIIEETLSVKIDGESNKNAIIIGKEELLESLNRLISIRILESKIDELNKIKNTPLLQKNESVEIIVNKNVEFDSFNESGEGKVVDQYFDNGWIYIVEKDGINYPIKKEQIISINEMSKNNTEDDAEIQ